MEANSLRNSDRKLNKQSFQKKEDLLHFVKKQFKELVKKNLEIPITLYQL
ncbi:MAG: hypothetical protein HYW86_01145 [Candidatus Roizmanbacteria bacterium]|nr:MAG: hypothetical protein HYW86_01145 [Candidatus Roizmanbacteria bacterium]